MHVLKHHELYLENILPLYPKRYQEMPHTYPKLLCNSSTSLEAKYKCLTLCEGD